MPTKTIDVRDAQHQLTELVAEVAAGTQVILMDGTQPRARLVPVTSSGPERVPGLHRGSMTTSPDFDEALPDEYWTGTA